MNKTEDQLISQFMQANKREIADNGFSRRVMNRLPMQAHVLSDILTGICVVLCGLLFVAFDGVHLVLDPFYRFLQEQTFHLVHNPIYIRTLLPTILILSYWGLYKVYTLKE